ncbi:MAG: hypothetical protein EXX96DRAFT_541278 [Benjaminiella poitrasii]|nr:MAG: hypothetical protein EXX96DRAFT_541278 [Benjaminiella poitrasii]
MGDKSQKSSADINTSEHIELTTLTSPFETKSITLDQTQSDYEIDQNESINEINNNSVETNKSSDNQGNKIIVETDSDNSDQADEQENNSEKLEETIIEQDNNVQDTIQSSPKSIESNKEITTNIVKVHTNKMQSESKDLESTSEYKKESNASASTNEDGNRLEAEINEKQDDQNDIKTNTESVGANNDAHDQEKTIESVENDSEAMDDANEPVVSRPIDINYVELKSYRDDSTSEENIERNKHLAKYGLFFTRDKHEHWFGGPKGFEKEYKMLLKKENEYHKELLEKRRMSEISSSKPHEDEHIKRSKIQQLESPNHTVETQNTVPLSDSSSNNESMKEQLLI